MISLPWINVILYIGWLLFAVHSIWLLWKSRNHLYMKKRRPFLIAAIVLFGMFTGAYYVIFDSRLCLFAFCNELTEYTRRVLYMSLDVCLSVLMTARVWFLFYDLKYAQALFSHQWWTDITDHKDWFIAHKATLGSLKYMYKYVSLCICAWFISNAVGIYFCVSGVLFAVGMNIYYVIMFVCFCKMPKLYDALHIRTEVIITTYIYCIKCLFHTIVCITGVEYRFRFIAYCDSFGSILVNTLLLVFMIWLPYYYYHGTDIDLNIQRLPSRSNSNNRFSITTDKKKWKPVRSCRSWQEYINNCDDDINFNTFVRHLIRLFAAENIYCVLEMMQFKMQFMTEEEIQRYLRGHVCYSAPDTGWIVKLPKDLPTSAIVEQNEGNYAKQITRLYHKYIKEDANMAINISWQSRATFMACFAIMDELNEQETLRIFDDILLDVTRNLKSSFIHFKANLDEYESPQNKDIISVMVSLES